jgi:hypothetical protein
MLVIKFVALCETGRGN